MSCIIGYTQIGDVLKVWSVGGCFLCLLYFLILILFGKIRDIENLSLHEKKGIPSRPVELLCCIVVHA